MFIFGWSSSKVKGNMFTILTSWGIWAKGDKNRDVEEGSDFNDRWKHDVLHINLKCMPSFNKGNLTHKININYKYNIFAYTYLDIYVHMYVSYIIYMQVFSSHSLNVCGLCTYIYIHINTQKSKEKYKHSNNQTNCQPQRRRQEAGHGSERKGDGGEGNIKQKAAQIST